MLGVKLSILTTALIGGGIALSTNLTSCTKTSKLLFSDLRTGMDLTGYTIFFNTNFPVSDLPYGTGSTNTSCDYQIVDEQSGTFLEIYYYKIGYCITISDVIYAIYDNGA
jgi:phage major head subunit gpT-like protein